MLQFTATGTGTFEVPRYDVRVRVDDLFAGDEGVGQLTGRLSLRGEQLTMELEAASPRLVVSGSGRIALTDQMDAELTLRIANTSLDPYLRFFEPRLSPFTTAVAGGTVRIVGELTDVDHLIVEGRVEQLDMKLFDYRVSNQDSSTGDYRPIELVLDQHVLNIVRFRLFGEGTQLDLDGHVNLHDSTIAVKAVGRCEPRNPAGLLPRHSQFGWSKADGGHRRARWQSPCSRGARRSRTAASGSCRCRTRSRRSTARSRSMPAGCALTACERVSRAAT